MSIKLKVMVSLVIRDILKTRPPLKYFSVRFGPKYFAPEAPEATLKYESVLNVIVIARILHTAQFSYSSSSLSSLPSGRSRRPMAPLLPVLSFFFEFTVSLRHHPVQLFLPWSSSSSLPLHSSLHYFSLKRVSSQKVSHPVSLSCSDCGYKRSILSYQC